MSENGAGAVVDVARARVRVRYAETDQMGVVYHANYLVWFEVGRVEFMRAHGFSYKQMELEEGCMIAVVEANVRYRAPARYDEELVVETRLVNARGSVIRFGYRVLREADDLLLCEGETVHVVVGRDMKRRRLPAKYAERLAAHVQSLDEAGLLS
jgi:acyl-CoA thioester hydrolase